MRYTVDVTTTIQENGTADIRASVKGPNGKTYRTTYRLTHNEMRASHDAKKLIAHHEQRVMTHAIGRAHSAAA